MVADQHNILYESRIFSRPGIHIENTVFLINQQFCHAKYTKKVFRANQIHLCHRNIKEGLI